MMKKEMSTLPEPVKAFNEELAEMLTQKPPVSSSKMKDITRCAMKAQKYYKHIVMSVEKLIQKCKPEFKLSGIYVIDAIVRQSKHQNKERDVYAGRFESNLHITATHLFKSSHTDQVKICRTFKLWELNKVFSYHSIQKCLNNSNPAIKKEGVKLAEDSFAKMADKPVVNPDIKKQQKELEEQRRKILEQQEELKRKQEALLKQNSSAIPPILGNLLHFGQQISDQTDEPTIKASETANKVKSLLDDFDYSDEDEIKQPTAKKGTPKSPQALSTPKKTENLATPSPVTTAHNTSIYEPDPPVEEQPKGEKYDTRSLEKLYTPSPVEKTSKKSKHKSPDKKEKKSHKTDRSSSSSKRDSDKSRDRDRSRERSRDRSKEEKTSSRRRSSPEKRSNKPLSRSGKRSRSASPDHYTKKRDRISKPDCVTVLSFTIWIGNLRKTVTKEDIASLMKKYTESCSIDMVPPRGCSYINVGDRDTAETVLREFKDLKLHGATCKVAWAPGKGCKELKEHWNIDKGATFVPHKTFEKLKISALEDGGEIVGTTLPDGFRIEESEGAGSILEKLLVSMKETTSDGLKCAANPLGQFLTNGRETAYITKQEEQVSAKLDMLNDIPMPSSVSQDSEKAPDDDSIVHLLNSKEYALPMPDNNAEESDYYYPGMSPPVSLDIPKDHVLPTSALTSPVAEEHLPYSRPVDEVDTPPAEPALDDSPMKLEKKTINLQTYLKRKKDDDPVTPVKDSSPEQLTPTTPVKTPKDTAVDDDLIEWASQDTEGMDENDTQSQELTPEKTPDKNLDTMQTPEKLPSPKTLLQTPEQSLTPEKEDIMITENVDNHVMLPEPVEDLEATIASIRSPSASPVDSLLEEKLASPTSTAFVIAAASTNLAPENMEEGELGPDSEEERRRKLAARNKKDSRSRSQSQSKKAKKDKKKRKNKKKKKDTGFDSDLEEDIRKLEFLKAELELEERREKKEKERRRERKRSASPNTVGKEKKKVKKEKRQKR